MGRVAADRQRHGGGQHNFPLGEKNIIKTLDEARDLYIFEIL
jgi:hypothetical protein